MCKKLYSIISKGFRLSFFILVSCLLYSVRPLGAEVISIDPQVSPVVTLPPEEARRLATLQDAVFPYLIGQISPNGKYVLISTPGNGMAFLNVISGETVAVNSKVYSLTCLTERRWLNNRILTYIGSDENGVNYQVKLNRRTGELSTVVLDLPGVPLSLSNKADKVVLVRLVESADSVLENRMQAATSTPPVKRINMVSGFSRPGPARFAFEERLTVPVATQKIAGVVYDLTSGEETPLLEVPQDTVVAAMEWSPRDRRLAIIRWKVPDGSRSGRVDEESAEVQDALGNLPQEDNPFFTSNTLDLFLFRANKVKHREIHPEPDEGVVFRDIDWDPSGMIFVAQMWTPSTPEGRSYPSFTNLNGSEYRFYWRNGQMISSLDRPEVEAFSGMPHMISPYEVLIHAPLEMDFKVFSYNLFNGELSTLQRPPGTVYQIKTSPKRNEIVYNYSSYQQPYELYRYDLALNVTTQLSGYNDHVASLNRIRADRIQFTLSNGAERSGYLLQPADAPFPPHNVPMVVWQQGGPLATMTAEWGNVVEMPFNLLPNFGIAVLVVPLPGRDGFGRDFLDSLADGRNFGQVDIEEQVEIVDQLVHLGYTSWNKTGITGCSYGGYFASQSVSGSGGQYGAANPQCSLLDLTLEWETGYTNLITYLMGLLPENEEEYQIDSPLSNAELVQTPTLIFAGTEDFLPSDLSKEFHDRISGVGTPTDFYEFIGEPHGLRQPTSQFVAGQAQLEWFRYYLQK